MKSKRREFLKISGLTGVGLAATNPVEALSGIFHSERSKIVTMADDKTTSLIGLYGPWAASLVGDKLPGLSYRKAEFKNLEDWKKLARSRLIERLGIPTVATPKVEVKNKLEFDGLSIEELSWQLPYGRPSEATLLKPKNANGKLPGILAFHDHAGNKYFGKQKITKTTLEQHTMMKEHQQEYYSGFAWANEIAKRGYVVLVPDAFPFESRRVWLKDVPEVIRKGLDDNNHNNPEKINAYNRWASDHEHIMAKSLFCSGTTWPGVFFLEDQKALDILCSRDDVDALRVGCGGLSGGGMRTVFMAGLDERIKCAVPVGFMTTWKDFLLNKSYTHTWMVYVPILPNELDFPEIIGLRTPLPTLVLNDSEDQLYTLPEMKRADTILREVYKKANADDRYKCSFYPGQHKFDSAMQAEAFEWFDKWLK
jgi:dienelactone hydrolase